MRAPLRLVGHGSLMSALGIGEATLAATRDARLVWIEGAPRGFHKPVQRGGCLAMDLGLRTATARGRTVSPRAPSPGAAGAPGFEGLLLWVDGDHGGEVARREGYAPDCWERLARQAGPRGVEAFLARLAAEAGDDLVGYREALAAAAGEGARFREASHYLPHPVETDQGPAVVYVAADPGETGDARPSCRAPYPELRRCAADAVFVHGPGAYDRFDRERQRWYAELCLLALAHGVFVADLLGGGLPSDHPVALPLQRWREDPAPLTAEREALRALPDLSGGRYEEHFPATLAEAWRRSGVP